MQNSEKILRPDIQKRGKKGVRFHEQKLLKTKLSHTSSLPLVANWFTDFVPIGLAGLCEKVFATRRYSVATDGKKMTVTTTGTRADGTAFTQVSLFERQ